MVENRLKCFYFRNSSLGPTFGWILWTALFATSKA